MRGSRTRRTKRSASQIVCLFLLLTLLSGILLFGVERSTDEIGRETAEIATYTYTERFEAYVFRDETAFLSTNNGPVEYLVPEGGAVAQDEAVANVYVGDLGGTVQRDRAAEIYAEIERLERSLERDVIAWQAIYFENYADMMGALGTGDLQAGLGAGKALADTLEKRSVLSDNGQAVRIRLAALYQEAEELIRNVKEDVHMLTASQDGYFTRITDGYEATFGIGGIADLTPETLRSRLSSPIATDKNVGKVIDGGVFYLAIPIPSDRAYGYVEGAQYGVSMTRGGYTSMTLERIATSEDGQEMLLILRAERMPDGMDYARRQLVEIEKEQVKGLRVPLAALREEQSAQGVKQYYVYVVKDGRAVKRPVEQILCHGESGVCIVSLSVLPNYLSVGEQILITSRTVYEGKELIR